MQPGRQPGEDECGPCGIGLPRRTEPLDHRAAERMLRPGARRGELGHHLAARESDDAVRHLVEVEPTCPPREVLDECHDFSRRAVTTPKKSSVLYGKPRSPP